MLKPNRRDLGSAPPFYSSQLPPERPHGMQAVIDEMNRSRRIMPGHITPRMPGNLSKKLNSKLNIYNQERLCKLILRYCGFDENIIGHQDLLFRPVLVNDWVLRDRKTGRFIGDERMVEYAMLLQTFQILQMSNQGEARESGNGWVTHLLRAALFVAALGAPVEMVIATMLHDSVEDARDPTRPRLKFRAFAKQDGQYRLVEYTGEEEILGYIRGNYWRYGARIAEDVRHVTRKQKRASDSDYLANPARYEKDYKEHLQMANARIGSFFAKTGDGKANINEIKSIADPEVKRVKSSKRLLKLGWHLESDLGKIAWPVFESLLYDLEKNSNDELAWKKHRFVPAEAIWNFAEGYNLIGKPHRYIQEVRDRLMPSRSPTIEIYSREGKPSFIFEFPFIHDTKAAVGMVEGIFGRNIVGEPKEVESKLPKGIRDATLVAADFRRTPEVSKLKDLAAAYDEKLDGIIEGGFDRKERTKEVWDRHYRLKNELKL